MILMLSETGCLPGFLFSYKGWEWGTEKRQRGRVRRAKGKTLLPTPCSPLPRTPDVVKMAFDDGLVRA